MPFDVLDMDIYQKYKQIDWKFISLSLNFQFFAKHAAKNIIQMYIKYLIKLTQNRIDSLFTEAFFLVCVHCKTTHYTYGNVVCLWNNVINIIIPLQFRKIKIGKYNWARS